MIFKRSNVFNKLAWMLTAIFSFLLIHMACKGGSIDETCPEQAFLDTLHKWELFMESSAYGSWQEVVELQIVASSLFEFGGEEFTEPPFYHPGFVDASGDTILISDRANQTLVAMNTDGVLLWKYGGVGEGPGYILDIGNVSISDTVIAVVNSGVSSVDLVSTDGSFVRRLTSVSQPQNLVFLHDGRLIVFSKQHPGGDVHLVDTDSDSVLISFGDGEWDPMNASDRSVFDIWAAEFPPQHLVYLSQFEPKFVVCDLSNYSTEVFPIRDLPYRVTPPDVSTDGSVMFRVMYPLIGGVFQGPSGEVCISLCGIKADGTMIESGSREVRAPVTPIDRYTLSGEYLDTFVLPDSVISRVCNLNTTQIAGIQSFTGKVIGYTISLVNQ